MYSTRDNDCNGTNKSQNVIREKTWELDNTWYSKNGSKNTNTIKMEQDLESEILNYIDMFRDKIVIDVLKVVVRDLNRTHDVTDGSIGGVKNFKKFKKVNTLFL